MRFIYPCIFKKLEDGTYAGRFPDLEQCEVTGDTLEIAIRNAQDAMLGWISVELEEEDPNLPYISHPEELNLAEDETVCNISVKIRLTEGFEE